MALIKDLLSFASTYLTDSECKDIEKAYHLSEKAHQGQTRSSGEPYIVHPVAVAQILAQYYLDSPTLQAALLHDVIEDTNVTKGQLEECFGSKVANLVDGVSKLKRIKFESRAHEQAENLRKMMFAVAQDIRVLLIKLADRLHNMRTLSYMVPEKQALKAKETIEIYAPIAHRLGMNTLKREFEDIGMKALYPWRYQVLSNHLQLLEEREHKTQQSVRSQVTEELTKQKLMCREFTFRRKNIYSLYKKMKRKRLRFDQITDVAGFRILVDSSQDCYRLLGILHSLFRPILSKFKDYIAIPKANGYQSIHTTILSSDGMPIEFQIRTTEMNAIAQKGIAAHWVYKNDAHEADTQNIRAYQWIKNVIDLQKTSRTPIEFIENMKIDLNPEEIYVFDECGSICILPRASTPIDLAYAQDVQKGNHCVGCKIEGRFMPLSTVLESGQKVEIITSSHSTPNPNWLSFAVSGLARAHIRSYLSNQQTRHAIELGRRLLKKDLALYGSSFENFTLHFNDPEKNQLLGKYSLEALLADVGMGRQIAHEVAQKFCKIKPGSRDESQGASPLTVHGSEKYVLSYAQCCYPIPHDEIIGFRQPGEGIVIHRSSCEKANSLNEQQESVPLVWDLDTGVVFQARLQVCLSDDIGALAVLSQIIAEQQANILSIIAQACDASFQNIILVLTVRDIAHLDLIIKKVCLLEPVHSAFRL